MLKNLLVVLALLCLSQAALFRIPNSKLELRSDSNGIINLAYFQGSGYVVPAYFSRGTVQPQYMIFSLYSSNFILTETCFQFNRYYCSQYSSCNRDTSKVYNVNYPYFSAQGNLASTEAVVDYTSWSLASNGPTLIATACSTQMTGSFGSGTYGIVGFGFNGNAINNFNRAVSSFSVYFNANFRLEFNPFINFPRRLVASVRTDQNWGIPNVESIAIGNSVNRLTGVKAIWDINSDAIGLPLAIYNTFVPALASYGIFCTQGVYYQPTCTFSQQLPNLSINPNGASSITLTPQIWALNVSGNQFKLNIRALSPSMNGLNYVHPDYQYTIILGNTVLGNYYHHFKISSSTVDIYQPL